MTEGWEWDWDVGSLGGEGKSASDELRSQTNKTETGSVIMSSDFKLIEANNQQLVQIIYDASIITDEHETRAQTEMS